MPAGERRFSETDERMMARALRAAALGHPSPNPHVGAVLVRNGEVISVGHHARCGLAHAEVVAIGRAGQRARGATLYVTFEPCNHYGRTGPCSDAIIRAGIRRVVIGCRDPAPHKPGAIKKLRAAGIEVVPGVLEKAAQRMVADFAKCRLQGLPLVTLKAAITLDGRIAGRTGESKWITGEEARREAHRLRAKSDAVMVGVGTVLADDPQLTVRAVRGRDPLRVVLDTHLRTPPGARVVRHGSRSPTLIFHAAGADPARKRRLEREGVELVAVGRSRSRGVSLRAVLRELVRRDVVRLLCEGGSRVHGSLLDSGLADRLALFVAPRILGDARALPLADGRGVARLADAWQVRDTGIRRLGDDILITGEMTGSRSRCSRD
jgi:diaminohydroxyphosphoribosylaminopyrimidine deaminase/5-amino-6-(5-phosphoribosylamino)uracil reductase